MKIYHNPRCSKSRQTLQMLQDKGVDVEIIEYLNDIPTVAELKDILQKLEMKPEQVLRKGEAVFKEKFKGKTLSDTEWINAMVENPKLIERPIVIKGNKAVLGRPPENVLELIWRYFQIANFSASVGFTLSRIKRVATYGRKVSRKINIQKAIPSTAKNIKMPIVCIVN
ncbi:MAG: arsenate reductase (glutaredoxin) [Flavobacteriales bacterium]|nr:arsenate reductase (glutaredoxin) [Flavobacteriales bacterium]